MTPKEKASELIEKHCQILFGDDRYVNVYKARQCALLTAQEMLGWFPEMKVEYTLEMKLDMLPHPTWQFWNEVKEEIEAL